MKRRAGAFPRAVLLLSMTPALIACTPGTDSAEDDAMHYASYQATTPPGQGDGAALSGTLAVRDGCLVVETGDGSVVVPVLPASATTWDGRDERLTVGASEYRVGAGVSFGGGFTDRASDVELPGACADLGERFLVSTV